MTGQAQSFREMRKVYNNKKLDSTRFLNQEILEMRSRNDPALQKFPYMKTTLPSSTKASLNGAFDKTKGPFTYFAEKEQD